MLGNPEMLDRVEVVDSGNEVTEANKELEKVEDPGKIADNLKNTKSPNFQERKLNFQEKDVDSIEKIRKNSIKEIEAFSYEILNIKGMDSNESDIPLKHRDQIVNAIDSLGEFETIIIKGTTDATLILGEGIVYNRSQFNEIRNLYLSRGGACPTYEELLQSPIDPQNTILGHRRAMQGVLSLNLTRDQMKKVEISNSLGNNLDDSTERGFEVDINYVESTTKIIKGSTEDFFYNILGDLKLQNFSHIDTRYGINDGSGYAYGISNLDLSTHIDGKMTNLFNKVVGKLPDVLRGNEATEQLVKNQIEKYLNSLIYTCGGKYNNGTRSIDSLTKQQYYLLKLVNDRTLNSEEFNNVLKGDKTVLLGRQLSNGKTIQEFLEKNKNNPIKGVGNETKGIYRYYVENSDLLSPKERVISEKDYLMLGLYFQILKS